MHSYEARVIYKSREAGSGDSRRATARVPTPLHTTPALTRLCWRMRLRGDSHPPAGRPRGSPLLWTGLESRFPRGFVGATLVVARLDRSMLLSFCIPTVIRQQSLVRVGIWEESRWKRPGSRRGGGGVEGGGGGFMSLRGGAF